MIVRTGLHRLRWALAVGIALSCGAGSLPQNPFDGLGLIWEGKTLVEQQTSQAITEGIAKFKEAFVRCQKNDNKMGMGAARFWEGIAYDSLGKNRDALNAFLNAARYFDESGLNPLFSRILLASDKDDSGAIEVREIYAMDLTNTNLVALSACETHLGTQSKRDDIIGLNRAFIYAGASSVIASLWTVDDKATSFLMKAFYSNLNQGLSKAAALQAAQTATRKKYPHPYYWAAFVLTGDAGR